MGEEAIFYVGQKALIEKDGKVLILFDSLFGLDFPGGKIQEGEVKHTDDLIISLKREVKEETGLEIEVFNPLTVWWFEFTNKNHKLFGKKVYIVLFQAKYISGEIKLSDEHYKFEWVDKNNCEKFKDETNGFIALKKYFSSDK